jgi:hypothetical protein
MIVKDREDREDKEDREGQRRIERGKSFQAFTGMICPDGLLLYCLYVKMP